MFSSCYTYEWYMFKDKSRQTKNMANILYRNDDLQIESYIGESRMGNLDFYVEIKYFKDSILINHFVPYIYGDSLRWESPRNYVHFKVFPVFCKIPDSVRLNIPSFYVNYNMQHSEQLGLKLFLDYTYRNHHFSDTIKIEGLHIKRKKQIVNL